MSNYQQKAFNPQTRKYEMADFLDNYYGTHEYAVKFKDGGIWREDELKGYEPVKKSKGKKNCKYCYGKGYSSQLVERVGYSMGGIINKPCQCTLKERKLTVEMPKSHLCDMGNCQCFKDGYNKALVEIKEKLGITG